MLTNIGKHKIVQIHHILCPPGTEDAGSFFRGYCKNKICPYPGRAVPYRNRGEKLGCPIKNVRLVGSSTIAGAKRGG